MSTAVTQCELSLASGEFRPARSWFGPNPEVAQGISDQEQQYVSQSE
jgi:hypothetical protein